MKKNKQIITFRYSNIYDMNLCRWVGEKWDDKVMETNLNYTKKLLTFWQDYEQRVFQAFARWSLAMPTSMVCYIVSPWPSITNFSDPLTLVRNNDLQETFSTLCHELAHVALSQPENKVIKYEIYEKIQVKFPDADYPTRIHVAVNFIQKSLLSELNPKAAKCLDKERQADEALYPGQKSAWHLIDNYLPTLDLTAPIESLRKI